MSELLYVPSRHFQEVRQRRDLQAEQKTELFASFCRINILYMITRAGSGHIGTSFSSIDLMSWLFLNEINTEQDVFFSSKGHDAPAKYSVLIGLGLLNFDLLHRLRRLEGLPGHPDVSVPFMHTNTGSLGMGISKAKGMALARRINNVKGNIYVLTGDGELQEGQFWESLQSASNQRLDEITVIVDHNKLQSDTWVASVSDLGDLIQKFQAFGWETARCNGHDLTQIKETFDSLRKKSGRPKILLADTIKGRGVSFMEHTALKENDRLYPFHSGAPNEDSYMRAMNELIQSVNEKLNQAGFENLALEGVPFSFPQPPHAQRLIPAYSKALIDEAIKNDKLVVLDADLALDTGLIPFEEAFPDRFFECGIAEQDMVSQAGGMALQGLVPVVHSFACFLSARPNEQIYNNSTERTKIIYVGSLAGLLPGGPGHSHQAVRDISALAAIPEMLIVEPSCEQEVAPLFDYCLNQWRGSAYFRLVSIPYPVPFTLPPGYKPELGKGVVLREGKDVLLIGYGPVLLSEAFRAAAILEQKQKLGVRLVNLPWLNKVDLQWLHEISSGFRWIFTLDNHYVTGGQGDRIASSILEIYSEPVKLKKLGVLEIPFCGKNDEVLARHRLDAEGIVETIQKTIEQR